MLDALKINRTEVIGKVTDFIQARVKASGLKGGVIGLSGGLDSAVTLFLSVKALDVDDLLAISMPYKESSTGSIDDARRVADRAGVELMQIDISPVADTWIEMAGDMDRVRKGNFLARVRMAILYDFSAKLSYMVIGTGNKSERLLGYTTLWGDMACGIDPLGGLYKTQVKDLAIALDVPSEVIEKPPSADLWPGQTDEVELGLSYEQADEILYYLLDREWELDKIINAGYRQEHVKRVKELYENSVFKRALPEFPVIK